MCLSLTFPLLFYISGTSLDPQCIQICVRRLLVTEIGLHLQSGGGSVHVERCFNFALIPSRAASTSVLAYLWHAGCPPLHTGTNYRQSFIAPFPAETRYSLRILINTVLQRTTNNPRNGSALKPACHSLVYTFRLFKRNNTNYSLKQLALGVGGGLWNCDPLFKK